MSLTVNCFQGLRIKELFCSCCAKKKPEDEESGDGKFANMVNQIVVLATPQIDFPELIVYPDLKLSDIVIFSNDENNDTLFTSVSGTTLLKAIQAAAPPPVNADRLAPPVDNDEVKVQALPKTSTPRGNRTRAASTNARSSDGGGSTPPTIAEIWVPTNPEDLCGKKLNDVLPDYLKKFLLPLYRQTLQGNYLQLTILWLGNTQLLRTFPLTNHKKQVIGGMAVTSPYNTDFAGDISRFTLNAGPEKQKM